MLICSSTLPRRQSTGRRTLLMMALICGGLGCKGSNVGAVQANTNGSSAIGADESSFCNPDAVMPNEELNALLVRGYGAFGTAATEALTSFFVAQNALFGCDFGYVGAIFNSFWSTYPQKTPVWFEINPVATAFAGLPVASYGLQMLQFIFDVNGNYPVIKQPKEAFITVVVADCTQGVIPQTLDEYNNQTGTVSNQYIDPRLLANDGQVIKESLYLFQAYLKAITKRQADFKVRIVHTPASTCPGIFVQGSYATLQNANAAIDSIDQDIRESTDLWLEIYPSALPSAIPEFKNKEFVTGVSTHFPGTDTPLITINDLWFLETPQHLGNGTYSRLQRQTYIPQWLQHEYFHHLFYVYRDLRLEVHGHDWFNHDFWPADFQGYTEPDYFDEAMRKRLFDASPALVDSLRNAPRHRNGQ